MIIYQPNPQPPELAAMIAANIAGKNPESGYGSALRQVAEQRRQQAEINAFRAEQRRWIWEQQELAAKEGRYF